MTTPKILFWLLLALPLPALASARQEDIRHLRNVIADELPDRGIDPNDIDRKLATMSDHDLHNLASEHEKIGYGGTPLTVVIASIVLLTLVVLVIVAIVD
jgi:hypothetical protein